MMFRRGSYGHARVIQVFAVFVFLTLMVFMFTSRDPPNPHPYTDGRPPRPLEKVTVPEGPSSEATYLKMLAHQYGLTKEVPWFARKIRSAPSTAPSTSVTEAKLKFMPSDFKNVRWDDEWLRLRSEAAIKLSVTQSPTPAQANASALIFGMSTTYSRVIYSNYTLINDWSRWLTDGKGETNGASLVLTLHQAETREVFDISERLKAVGIDATVSAADDTLDATARYIDLIGTLAKRNAALSTERREKKFLALVDDDVFFPTLGQLMSKLSHYNSDDELYIGVPSERADWIVENNAIITYGGGAVFLSSRAAKSVSQLPCLKKADADDSSHYPAQWDMLLHECILKHTSLDMHIMPSFYSPRDDIYGIQTVTYEAGVSPLTLHHYRNRHRFEPGKGHLVASICGEECFLQRYKFQDDWILVNGYSISQYPDGVDVVAMDEESKMVTQQYREEKKLAVGDRLVIDEADADADGQDRKVVTWGGRKRTWRFLDSTVGANGEVWQAYVKRKKASGFFSDGDDRLPSDIIHTDEEPSDVDSIIVLIWEP